MQSYPLHWMRFSQYQASSAAMEWLGDRDYYLMHNMQLCGYPYTVKTKWWTSPPSSDICGIVGDYHRQLPQISLLGDQVTENSTNITTWWPSPTVATNITTWWWRSPFSFYSVSVWQGLLGYTFIGKTGFRISSARYQALTSRAIVRWLLFIDKKIALSSVPILPPPHPPTTKQRDSSNSSNKDDSTPPTGANCNDETHWACVNSQKKTNKGCVSIGTQTVFGCLVSFQVGCPSGQGLVHARLNWA